MHALYVVHNLKSTSTFYRNEAGVVMCQDPRNQLSCAELCSPHKATPGHAATPPAHMHVTVCQKVCSLATRGRAISNPDTQTQ